MTSRSSCGRVRMGERVASRMDMALVVAFNSRWRDDSRSCKFFVCRRRVFSSFLMVLLSVDVHGRPEEEREDMFAFCVMRALSKASTSRHIDGSSMSDSEGPRRVASGGWAWPFTYCQVERERERDYGKRVASRVGLCSIRSLQINDYPCTYSRSRRKLPHRCRTSLQLFLQDNLSWHQLQWAYNSNRECGA